MLCVLTAVHRSVRLEWLSRVAHAMTLHVNTARNNRRCIANIANACTHRRYHASIVRVPPGLLRLLFAKASGTAQADQRVRSSAPCRQQRWTPVHSQSHQRQASRG